MVREHHPALEHNLLLGLGDRGFVADLGHLAVHERVDQRRLAHVRDADDHRAHASFAGASGARGAGKARAGASASPRAGPSAPRSLRPRRRGLAPPGSAAAALEVAEPRGGHRRVGEVALAEDLDARLLLAKLGDHGVLAGGRHASVEHLDDDVVDGHRLGDRAPSLGHVARVPLRLHPGRVLHRPAAPLEVSRVSGAIISANLEKTALSRS